MSKLRNCPLCGGPVRFNYDATLEPNGVICPRCHALTRFMRVKSAGRSETYGDTQQRIADLWNRRNGEVIT